MWTLGLKRFTCSVLCTLLWILHPIVEKWTFKFWAHFTVKSSSLNTLGNMSLQNVAVTNNSLCTGRTTSLSSTSWWQEEKKRKTSRWQIASCILGNFVSVTKFSRYTNTKFYATCCRDKNFVEETTIFPQILQYETICR